MSNWAWLRNASVAAALGVAWPFVLNALFAHSGSITVALTKIAVAVDLRDGARIFVRVANAIIWALTLGAGFGLPLGFVGRSKPLTYWAIFIGTLLVVSFVTALSAPRGVESLILSWSVTESWLYVLAVLAFAFAFSSLQRSRSIRGATAP